MTPDPTSTVNAFVIVGALLLGAAVGFALGVIVGAYLNHRHLLRWLRHESGFTPAQVRDVERWVTARGKRAP